MPTIPKALDQLAECVRTLRRKINTEPTHQRIIQSPHWKQICACLDVLEDTTLALEAYWNKPETTDIKIQADTYLHFYGVLQALFVQQDAVYNLGEALDPRWNEVNPRPEEFFRLNPYIERTRRIRNISIGHPTKRKGGAEFGFIRRAWIFKSSCDVETLSSDGNGTRETFQTNEAIYQQLKWAASYVLQFKACVS